VGLLLAISILIWRYFAVKLKTGGMKMDSFSYIFTFIVLWTISLVVYYTDAYIDYFFRVEIWLLSVPLFFTFVASSITIENLMQIYLVLIKS
jgi:hypothetical protein